MNLLFELADAAGIIVEEVKRSKFFGVLTDLLNVLWEV